MVSDAAIRALALHQRLIAGDPTATAEVIGMMLKPLYRYLTKRHSRAVSDEALYDIAVDALMSYVRSPLKFDPDQAGLFRYLTLIADRDVQDAIRKLTRQPREVALRSVEDGLPPTNSGFEADEHTTHDGMEGSVDASRILQRYYNDICRDPGDERILGLILEGETQSPAFARAMGLDEPDSATARAVVFRAKDKITRRLRRLRDKLENG